MKLAEIFRDNMVLQRGKPIAVFGSGEGSGYIEFCGKTTRFSSENGETELADCKIKGNKLFVYFKDSNPCKITMGYCKTPDHNLYNSAGYLASPFEIDLRSNA